MPAGMTVRYDTLGNLVSDTSRKLYELRYDYRNLMTYARVAPTVVSPLAQAATLDMVYDEDHQRIQKHFRYQELQVCNDTLPGGGDLPLGVEMMSGTLGLSDSLGGGAMTEGG